MRTATELTDPAIKNAKPAKKPYRMGDVVAPGLNLRVGPTGTKSWEFRYTLNRQKQTASLGRYPAVTLKRARERAQEARELAADGKQVTAVKNAARAAAAIASATTFGVVAADWIADEAKRRGWCDGHTATVAASLRNHLGRLSSVPVASITALMVDPDIRKVQASAPDVGRKVRQRLRSILGSAKRRGMIEVNPLADMLPGPTTQPKHYPAELSHAGVGAILRAADRAGVCEGVQRAHMLCAYTAQRIGEVVGATWSEVDFTAATWTIPRARMKYDDARRGPHVVPLPPGLLAAMRKWKQGDPQAVYVCPSPTTENPITSTSVEKMYRKTLELAGKHSPHSWRSVFSTWGRDAGMDREAIEKQLDHAIGNEVQQAYDRADRLEIRRAIVKAHENALIAARDGRAGCADGAVAGAQVVQMAQWRA